MYFAQLKKGDALYFIELMFQLSTYILHTFGLHCDLPDPCQVASGVAIVRVQRGGGMLLLAAPFAFAAEV